MLLRNLILPGVVVPAVAGGLVFLLASWRRRPDRQPTGAGALALAAGFFAAYVALTGWPRWPPVEATQRTVYAVAAAALATLAFVIWRRAALPWIVRAALVVALVGLVLESQVRHRWSTAEAVAWIAGFSLIALVLGWAFHRSLREEGHVPGRLLGAAVRLTLIGGTAVVLGLSASALLAQLAGAVACAMATVEAIGLMRRRPPWHGADALTLLLALVGLMLVGFHYAALEPLPAVLVVLAFLIHGIAIGKRPTLRLAPLLPLAAAVTWVVVAFLNQPEDPYAEYYAAFPGDAERAAPVQHVTR